MTTPQLQDLLDYYRMLDERGESRLLYDDLFSLAFYRTELKQMAGTDDAHAARSRMAVWVRTARRVDQFVATAGHFPRETKQGQDEVRTSERALADWARYQRRPATRERHCSYQVRRLQGIPGFHWDPAETAWRETLSAYETFVRSHHRAPAARSTDATEWRLASWAAKQRHHHKRGRLAGARTRELEQLPIWAWGHPA